MTWTYDPSTIVSNPTAQVRLLIGDTNASDQLMQDEEIAFLLLATQDGMTIWRAASRCCEVIASQYARLTDTQIGDLKVHSSQRYKQYTNMARKIRTQSYTHDLMPYAGGLSISDKTSSEEDVDRVPPFEERNMLEYPGTQDDNRLTPSEEDETF